jgi:hypothetical protein
VALVAVFFQQRPNRWQFAKARMDYHAKVIFPNPHASNGVKLFGHDKKGRGRLEHPGFGLVVRWEAREFRFHYNQFSQN